MINRQSALCAIDYLLDIKLDSEKLKKVMFMFRFIKEHLFHSTCFQRKTPIEFYFQHKHCMDLL
jgi:hypothetical protein